MKKFRCCFIDPQLGEHDSMEIMAEDYVLAKISFQEKNASNSLSFSCPKISTHDLETDEIIEFDNADFGKTPHFGKRGDNSSSLELKLDQIHGTLNHIRWMIFGFMFIVIFIPGLYGLFVLFS